MASASNYPYHFFPYFPPTPPHNFPSPPISPPSHTPPKPAPPSPTTPTSHTPPTPPKATPPSKTSPPSPHVFPTPPPPHHIVPTPPPPHIQPIPPPPPHVVPTPPPPPGHHSTVIVVVFVSLGGLFFLAFMAVALCCFIKKRKKSVQETDVVKINEHLKIQEAIIPGPHGTQTVILSVEDDVHIQEEINKNIETVCKGSHLTSAEGHPQPKVLDLEASTSSSEHHQHLEHKTA